MPFKKFSLLIAAAAVTSVGALASLLYIKTVTTQAYSLVESAKKVPEEAMMATFVSPNPQALADLRRFGTPEAQTWINQGLTTFKQQSLAGTTLNFDRDLKPWMGGVMVALLPSQNSEDPNLLMVIGIKNHIKAWNFARKFNTQADIQRQESQYKGLKIVEYTEAGGKRYSVAVLGSHILVAADRKAVEQAIDTVKGEPSLADEYGSNEMFLTSEDVPNPIVTLYVADYPSLMQQIATTSKNSEEFSLQILSQLKPIESIVMAMGVNDEGMRLVALTHLDPQTTHSLGQPELEQLVERFPAETLGFVHSQGINQFWVQMLALAQDNANLEKVVNQIRQGLGAINLDADRDVFEWMDGEFALGLIASDEGVLAPLGLGGVLLLETSDRPQAQKMLNQLDTIIANSNPPVNVEQRTLAGIDVTEWKDPQQGTLFGHGWLTPNWVFIAFGESVVEVMTTEPSAPLLDNPRFQNLTQSLPQPNHSYVYLDVEQLLSWATGYLLASPATALQPNVITLLNSVQSLGVSATWLNSETARVEMILALQDKRN